MAHPEAVPREMLAMAIAAAAIPGADIAAQSMLRKVMDIRGVRPGIMLRREMAHLKVPTLFVWGPGTRTPLHPAGRAWPAKCLTLVSRSSQTPGTCRSSTDPTPSLTPLRGT